MMENLTVYEVTQVSTDAPHEPTTKRFSTYEKAVAYAEEKAQELANDWGCEIEVTEYNQAKEFKIFHNIITVFPVKIN